MFDFQIPIPLCPESHLWLTLFRELGINAHILVVEAVRDAISAPVLYWQGEIPGRALRREIVPIALRYQLVTEYTSLVAVDRSTVARPPNSSLHRSEIKRNLPFGMDYEKIWDQTVAPKMMHMAPVPSELLQDVSFRRAIGLPATASPAVERLVWGEILLLLGSMVFAVVVFGRLTYTKTVS